DPRNLARQGRGCFEKAAHITEHRAGLINRGGKNESHPLLTRSKLVLLEQREVDRDRGRHPALAGTSASNGPQLAHAMVGRGTVAGDRAEDLKLGLVEGSAECRLQNHEPGAPGVDVAERAAPSMRWLVKARSISVMWESPLGGFFWLPCVPRWPLQQPSRPSPPQRPARPRLGRSTRRASASRRARGAVGQQLRAAGEGGWPPGRNCRD